MTDSTINATRPFEMPRTILTGSADSKSRVSCRQRLLKVSAPHICSCKFDTILSSQRSPSFVGAVVFKKRHTMLEKAKTLGFSE